MDEFLEILKKVLKEAGLSEDSDNFKTIYESKEFEVVKDKLDTELPETFDQFLKLPNMQSEFDKRQTQAVKTREDNLKKKFDFKEKSGAEPEPNNELLEKFAKLEEKLEARDKQDLQKSKLVDAGKLLSEKKIPKSYLKHFDLDSETSLNDQLVNIEKDWDEVKQEYINANVKGGQLPTGGTSGKVTEEEAKAMAESI